MMYDEEGMDNGFKIGGDDDEMEIPESMNEDFGLDEEDPDRDS